MFVNGSCFSHLFLKFQSGFHQNFRIPPQFLHILKFGGNVVPSNLCFIIHQNKPRAVKDGILNRPHVEAIHGKAVDFIPVTGQECPLVMICLVAISVFFQNGWRIIFRINRNG